ncbi:hypothetical protein I7I50_11499 [Histoplasma capsulatum G186AR]|uniref:Uncharacterized protein n=1 Tax=Ajellomyces capsulatus TaxID=5037 RepID=A0A8H7ZAW6_AJECA|nr:hypothetical protein I7I52_02736 [Histoplasma capsulatum]QSS70008.1 hypothetical protein I7I50_11499 [Histoplasma capsulatum G186AR]
MACAVQPGFRIQTPEARAEQNMKKFGYPSAKRQLIPGQAGIRTDDHDGPSLYKAGLIPQPNLSLLGIYVELI